MMLNKLKLLAASSLTALMVAACSGPSPSPDSQNRADTSLSSQKTESHDDHNSDETHDPGGHNDEDHGEEDHGDQGSDEHSDDNDAHSDHNNHDDGEAQADLVRMSVEAQQDASIEFAQVGIGIIGQSLSQPAEVRFDTDRVANVSPRVSGIIGRLFVNEGDVVEKGDTLALIKSRELASLKASWQMAETEKRLAAQALEREEQLWTDKITSEADLEAARAAFAAASAASAAAENELHAAGVSDAALERIATAADGDNANSYLTAPIAGTIVRRTVNLGETVSAGDSGAAPLFTIVDDSVLWADIAVYKQDVGRVRVGAPVALKDDAGTILAQSEIALVLPIIDETSRTATARVIINNPEGGLRPGQFVTADISVGSSQSVLRVPEAAVQLVENQASVFIPVEGGFTPRAVLLGNRSGGFVQIRSGLRVGETIVVDGAFTLKAQLEKDAFGDGHGH